MVLFLSFRSNLMHQFACLIEGLCVRWWRWRKMGRWRFISCFILEALEINLFWFYLFIKGQQTKVISVEICIHFLPQIDYGCIIYMNASVGFSYAGSCLQMVSLAYLVYFHIQALTGFLLADLNFCMTPKRSKQSIICYMNCPKIIR